LKHFYFTGNIVILLEKKCFGYWKKELFYRTEKIFYRAFNLLPLKSMEQSIRKIRTAKSLAMAKKAIRAHCKSLPI